MTGLPNHNRDRLRMYAKFWEDEGYHVVNPGTFFEVEPGPHISRPRALQELSNCKYMIVLPEWKDHPDSFVNDEMHLAARMGMPLLYAESYKEPSPLMESVLQEAQRIVYGKRQVDYGHPCVSLNQIAQLWTGYAEARTGSAVIYLPIDVAMMMVLSKVGRTLNSPRNRDHFTDIAGWAAVAARALHIDP